MTKKLTDLIPIKGAHDVYVRSNRESQVELKRALLGEWDLKGFSYRGFKEVVYSASICVYNAALAYGLYKLLTIEVS